MSFAEKIAGLLARPNPAGEPEDPEIPWYQKYGTRLLGCVAAFFAIIFGLWNMISIIFFSVSCVLSGVIQILAGFIVMMVEAPCCFICIEQADIVAKKVESKSMYFRAGLYCAIAVPPIFLCFGLASVFGSGLIFATGVSYGMMALGKKASLEDMRAAAANSGIQTPTTSDRANIVKNAQPYSFTGAVGTDSNV